MTSVQSINIETGSFAGGCDPPRAELESVDCPLCACAEHTTLVVGCDALSARGGHYRVVRCDSCEMCYTNPRPTEAAIVGCYPQNYKRHVPREWNTRLLRRVRRNLERALLQVHYGYPVYWPDLTTRIKARVARLRLRHSRQRQSWIPYRLPGRLLDYRCGATDFLQEMREFGWSVRGLDPNETVAREVSQCTGVSVDVGGFEDASIEPGSYDAVTMWNALEREHRPRDVVAAAHDALRPGGILVAGAANIASWSFEQFQQEWHGLELPRHLNHFEPRTLCALLETAGFQILSVQHIGRVGWIRRSAENALVAGWGTGRHHRLRWKPFARRAADRTERRHRADFIRVIAEKKPANP